MFVNLSEIEERGSKRGMAHTRSNSAARAHSDKHITIMPDSTA